jgi:hypothetical protein
MVAKEGISPECGFIFRRLQTTSLVRDSRLDFGCIATWVLLDFGVGMQCSPFRIVDVAHFQKGTSSDSPSLGNGAGFVAGIVTGAGGK